MADNPNFSYNPVADSGRRGLTPSQQGGKGIPRDGNVKPLSEGNTDKPPPAQPVIKPWPSLQPDLELRPSDSGDGDGKSNDDGKGPDKESPKTPKEETKPAQDEGEKQPDDKGTPTPGGPKGGKVPPTNP